MRAISKHQNFTGPTLQNHNEMVLATGDKQVMQQGYIAAPFIHGDVTEWERAEALKHFRGHFDGLLQDEEPVWRLSSYDTDDAAARHGWTAEEKAKFEAVLVKHAGPDYIIVDRPKLVAPWPSYDKLKVQGQRTVEKVAEKIADTVRDNGYDPDAVLAYERENLARPEVIKAVEALKAEAPADDAPVVTA